MPSNKKAIHIMLMDLLQAAEVMGKKKFSGEDGGVGEDR